jgi:uncharacterized protein (UPF0335 family)
MNFINKIIEGNLIEAKQELFERLNEIAALRLEEAKKTIASETFEVFDEAVRRNPNIIRMGRIQKIRRRIRRNAKGKIVLQKNVRRSGVKGYRVSGSTLKRIPAAERLRKARKLKQSWKTTRRAKLRRTLMKRKMSLRRRSAMGLR